MQQQVRTQLRQSVADFRLPSYEEIPDVGLYLEQVTKYISDYYRPLSGVTITGSMISNYVKKGLIANPVKKQYDREQIAYLIFIAAAKSVLSLDHIQLMVNMQQKTYNSATAYNYFCHEMENIIRVVFGLKESLEDVDSDASDEKMMLRNTMIAIAHKIYLARYFEAVEESSPTADHEPKNTGKADKA